MSKGGAMRVSAKFVQMAHLPVTMSVADAGRWGWGISRQRSYEMAQAGTFPCEVRRIGTRYHVCAADLLRAVGLDPERILLEQSALAESLLVIVEDLDS